ncbi:MAG: hypothetical protein RL748_4064 [Pseudomonadota bacterium]|jgi:Xaa-Pro aminopeptidase
MSEPKAAPVVAYPWAFKHDGNERILLWADGGREKDYFLKTEAGQLFIGDSITQMRKELSSIENIAIHWDESGQIDLDQFWKKIRGLRNGRASSKETCSVILAGWNFLEDLARTVAVRRDLPIFTDELAQRAYEKIFGGCNLPAVTPESREYQPIWQTDEIAALRSAMKQLWQCIVNIAPRLIS